MHIANRYKIRNMGLNLTAKHVADYSLYIVSKIEAATSG